MLIMVQSNPAVAALLTIGLAPATALANASPTTYTGRQDYPAASLPFNLAGHARH